MLGVFILVLIVAAAATWGRRIVSTAGAEKRDILSSLEGQYVTLGIGTRFVVSQTGKVAVGDDPFFVALLNGTTRAVPLADIRWVDGPDGQRKGGPW